MDIFPEIFILIHEDLKRSPNGVIISSNSAHPDHDTQTVGNKLATSQTHSCQTSSRIDAPAPKHYIRDLKMSPEEKATAFIEGCTAVGIGDTSQPCKDGSSIFHKAEQERPSEASSEDSQLPSNVKLDLNEPSDPLSRVPVEILANIFADVSSPFLLGSICWTWRRIAWSTPQLWKSISIDVCHPHKVDILESWLNRSGQLPLTIRLHKNIKSHRDDFLTPAVKTNIDRLMRLLSAHSDRWLELDVNLPRRLLAYVGLRSCGNLATLYLEVDDFGELNFYDNFKLRMTIEHAPNLRNVTLRNITLDEVSINWPSITHANFRCTIDTIYKVIQKAHSLEHLGIHGIQPIRPIHPTSEMRPHLTSLCISTSSFYIERFLDSLVLPMLKKIEIRHGYGPTLIPIHNLLRRSQCKLRSLKFTFQDSWMFNIRDLNALLAEIPYLETLTLCHPFADYPSHTSSRTFAQVNFHENHTFLPNLQNVHVEMLGSSDRYTLHLDLCPNRFSGRSISHPTDAISTTVHFHPVFVSYLLNPDLQKLLQPVIKSGFETTPSQEDLIPFTNFLQQTLRHYSHVPRVFSFIDLGE
ncbi:hypothetical protein BDN70DRAFT_998536 [Pholiota conissans]|uniref:F-box domain-containing protein n=1 Tax=Pholiota conissans TaxID=109636 RepID=A0A9P5YMR8_9AGAR|nr:hypothetical protein BDN70DRAFT_998536 [Pholiota conissans]